MLAGTKTSGEAAFLSPERKLNRKGIPAPNGQNLTGIHLVFPRGPLIMISFIYLLNIEES